MTRALVLGGGGPVGIGWEAGLVTGLREAGVDVGAADLILGTSAGSVVGGQLARGADLVETVELAGAATGGDSEVGDVAEGIATLMDAMVKAATEPGDPLEVRRRLGKIAASAETVDEETYLTLFAAVVGETSWPARYACTAIDIDSGELKVWDEASGAPLAQAIASSCAVPGVFPPVTIDGRRYMDGGMKSAMNTDVAAGYDAVITVSCFALELPEGMSDPTFDAMKAGTDQELDAVRAAGSRLEVVVPGAEMLEISGWGLHLMDGTKAKPAYEAGKRQAAEEAERLKALWG